jgi:hypothetical protein
VNGAGMFANARPISLRDWSFFQRFHNSFFRCADNPGLPVHGIASPLKVPLN